MLLAIHLKSVKTQRASLLAKRSRPMSKFQMFIDGEGISGREHFAVVSPANGETVGMAPAATREQFEAAVYAAHKAFGSWRSTSDEVRRDACQRIANRINACAEELAQLLTREQGKPLNGLGSRFEVSGAEAWARHTATLELRPETVQNDSQGRIEIHRQPLGVVASVTPWNWPILIAAWHLLPAIRAGNTVVIKPSPLTPLSTLRLVQAIAPELPAGVINSVTGHDELAPLLTAHPDVAKVMFTGSTPTGSKVMMAGAATIKRMTLELGGNDAGIVLPDVDPRAIVERLFWSSFINSGQTCAALKRLYVAEPIYEPLCRALTEYAAQVRLGDGLDERTQLGPVKTRSQMLRLEEMVEAASAGGARVLLRGSRGSGNAGNFYPVTLLAEARSGMRIVDEEQFGPVLPIILFRDVDEAVEQANATPYGLGGSVWSGSEARAWELASRLECGTVWVNRHGDVRPDVPFGGIKSSGIGVSFGR